MLLLLRRRGTSPLLTSLISFWELEEASGTRLDAHGTNHLTDNNTVTQASGRVGQAAQFTAANSEYLSIADNPALSMGDIDFTLGAWVYLDSKTTRRSILAKSNTTLEFILEYFQSNDQFRFGVSFDGSGFTTILASAFGSPSTAAWYFVVAWHDSVANTINIHVNNGTVNSAAHATGVFNGSSSFDIGRALSGFYMDGRIDQAFVSKRILTAAERTWLYNGGAGRSYADLRAYRG